MNQNEYAVLEGSFYMTGSVGSSELSGTATANLPTGFIADDCVVMSTGIRLDSRTNYTYGTEMSYGDFGNKYLRSSFGKNAMLNTTNNSVTLNCYFKSNGNFANPTNDLFHYRIVIMKTPK